MVKHENRLDFDTPANYRIQIQGNLDNSWATRFGEMTFTSHLISRRKVTVITGQVVDQAELMGILNHLYGMGFPLLSVEQLEVGE